MQFRSLQPPEFILLAIKLSLKSASFLAMPCHNRNYIISISTLKLNYSPVRGSILMRFRSLELPEFILLPIEFSLKSVAKCKFCEFEIVIASEARKGRRPFAKPGSKSIEREWALVMNHQISLPLTI